MIFLHSNFLKKKIYEFPCISRPFSIKSIHLIDYKVSTTIAKSLSKLEEPNITRRIVTLLGLLTVSRIGIYLPVSSQIDTTAFSEALGSSGGLMGYEEIFLGTSLSKFGIFSLGIIPNINASIIMQFISSVSPQLKKLNRDEGPSGRNKFYLYQKILTLILALIQAVGELNYIRPFVSEFNFNWLFENTVVLATGAIILTFLSNEIDRLKLGNGTSILIFSNILSTQSFTLGISLNQLTYNNFKEYFLYVIAFVVTVFGISYVQEAERKIPIFYANRSSDVITRKMGQNYHLPFKVNATGVMPIILSSSLLAFPATVSRFTNNELLQKLALSFSPASPLYTPYSVVFIFLLNYFYTFIQFNTDEIAENLKKSGASIPQIRPGKSTAEFLDGTLIRMSFIGSLFLSLLALAQDSVRINTNSLGVKSLGGTSLLILVGVAADLARRLRAETLLNKYRTGGDLRL